MFQTDSAKRNKLPRFNITSNLISRFPNLLRLLFEFLSCRKRVLGGRMPHHPMLGTFNITMEGRRLGTRGSASACASIFINLTKTQRCSTVGPRWKRVIGADVIMANVPMCGEELLMRSRKLHGRAAAARRHGCEIIAQIK